MGVFADEVSESGRATGGAVADMSTNFGLDPPAPEDEPLLVLANVEGTDRRVGNDRGDIPGRCGPRSAAIRRLASAIMRCSSAFVTPLDDPPPLRREGIPAALRDDPPVERRDDVDD